MDDRNYGTQDTEKIFFALLASEIMRTFGLIRYLGNQLNKGVIYCLGLDY